MLSLSSELISDFIVGIDGVLLHLQDGAGQLPAFRCATHPQGLPEAMLLKHKVPGNPSQPTASSSRVIGGTTHSLRDRSLRSACVVYSSDNVMPLSGFSCVCDATAVTTIWNVFIWPPPHPQALLLWCQTSFPHLLGGYCPAWNAAVAS